MGGTDWWWWWCIRRYRLLFPFLPFLFLPFPFLALRFFSFFSSFHCSQVATTTASSSMIFSRFAWASPSAPFHSCRHRRRHRESTTRHHPSVRFALLLSCSVKKAGPPCLARVSSPRASSGRTADAASSSAAISPGTALTALDSEFGA